MKKTKGFTLIELVVGIAVSSIILTMLGSMLFFGVYHSNKIALNSKTFENANTFKNTISQYYDLYNDESLIIEENMGYVSLFKTNNHKLYYLDEIIYLDETPLYKSVFDVNVSVVTKTDIIVYNINYSVDESINLIKGRI